ncbi:MAG: LuxR C-terminal-related transcriptional regulator [Devosia sp.]|nr:LuxR C-terminal-related transcriptional regulator [Devosia sp.]
MVREAHSPNGEYPRERLIELILGRDEPIIVIETPAGAGKSTLLRQLARRLETIVHMGGRPPAPGDAETLVLWDITPGTTPGRLPELFVAGAGKIVIAKRPEPELPGLARARTYGRVFTLRTGDLLFSRDELALHLAPEAAERIFKRTGGWPLLRSIDDTGWGREDLTAFLRTEFLDPMPTTELFAVHDLLLGKPIAPRDEDRLVPLARRTVTGDVMIPDAIRDSLADGLDALLRERVAIPTFAKEMAEAYAARGETTEAIVTFQNAGYLDEALRTFSAGSDRFYIYLHGSSALDRVLAGFPEDFARQSDIIVMSLAMQALKRGEVARALLLLENRFGPAANDLATVFKASSGYSADFRAFRVVMLIYEDYLLTDELFEQAFAMLGDFAPEAHLVRGSLYNAILEFYIRGRRFAAAEDVAVRALGHYEQANVPILAFYICLNQSLMRLMMGDAVAARERAADAAARLQQVRFECPNDARLLALLNACIDYESGKAEPLARFLSVELEAFSHGEIWPSLIEFALQYGSQALSEHFSTIAARNFLDRWRVYQVRNRQFGMMIAMREAAILQNGNRWQEAAEKLSPIPSRIGRAWVMAAVVELERLHDRDEIALALIWLRHIVYEMPTRPNLDAQLTAMLNNLNLTSRQRTGVEIWLAFVCKRQRNLSRARALLQTSFENAARLGAIAPLAEERIFLSELIEHQRIGEYLDTSGPVRQVLRRLRENGLPNSPLGEQNGLSRRETRVLLMICEGGSNKFIANALGLSEATVKFHLGNVYRKLGCKKRRDAITAARALSLVS